jgi:hypothetical protein
LLIVQVFFIIQNLKIMKKLLLLTLVMSVGLISYSQLRPIIPKELKNCSVVRKHQTASDPVPPMVNVKYLPAPYKSAEMLINETVIAETVYDSPSNAMLGNRIWAWDDGTIAAVCTWGMLDPSFADRGTGYNYFNGNSWGPMPTQRIENIRCGWPNIAPWGAGEIGVAHNGTTGLEIIKRDSKGTGAWSEALYQGPPAILNDPTWPRMTTSGDNHDVIHMFYNSYVAYEGQTTALLYSRSMDGGTTWDPQDVILNGMGADYYLQIGADDYVLASRGNTVALLCASMSTDMFIMKSNDNGDTWEKIMIWENPYPFFDYNTTLTTDTLWSMDNSADVAIDANGLCHVVYGITRWGRWTGTQAGYYTLFYGTDGIGYWNESMGQIPEAENPHQTLMPENLDPLGMYIGWTQDMDGNGTIDIIGDMIMTYSEVGVSTMPNISIADDGAIAVVYASINEDADNTINYYKRLWARASSDLGTTWGDFVNLNADIIHIFDECVFPVLAKNSPNNKFHLIYQADNWPGSYVNLPDPQQDPVVNRVYHMAIEKSEIVGIKNPANSAISGVSISQNAPNPTNTSTSVIVEIRNEMPVSLKVCNLTGQRVFEIPTQYMRAGSHSLTIDVSGLTPGVYFYTVIAGTQSITKKMIVE